MKTRIVFPALVLLAIAGCDTAPSAVETPITFTATGAYNAEYWSDATVPGSQTPRPGVLLPLYLVCAVDGDENARAAAIINTAELRLYKNGSAQLSLDVGTWMRRDGVVVAWGETISRSGNWTEEATGQVKLAGFNVPGLGQTLQYTELGNAELPVTLACPSGSTAESLKPTLTFSRAQ